MKKSLCIYGVSLSLLSISTIGFPGLSDLTDLTSSRKISAALDVAKAVTVSDEEVIGAANEVAKWSDNNNKVASSTNAYALRLEKLTKKHTKEDGLKLNFKVYVDPEVNAFSLADGTVRVNTGLLDAMNDDEVLGIIGHEIGHVKNGHIKARMRTAYLASAARKGVASTQGVAGNIASSKLGGMAQQLLKAQFSQGNEKEADDYGLKFLKKHGYKQEAWVSALLKLNGESSLFSTHPGSEARAKRIKGQIGEK